MKWEESDNVDDCDYDGPGNSSATVCELLLQWELRLRRRGILGRAPTVRGTFKPVPQPRLEVPARTGRHMFSQQRRLPCDSNWGANPVKPLKGTPLPVEPTLC
ncbi:hypothetical protein WN944_010105 [Citrus x changshan-huyou]|uniref:Uncharacterized protein n=1 Tax=Citrus x changshan-huyou TaxID=2935761 RepID=A0AAP0MXC3_9ROSI